MTDRPLPAAPSIDAVVHSFTQSELALAEVTNAIAKFRTASEQLAGAEDTNAIAVVALKDATAATERVVEQLSALVVGLNETVSILRAIDPDRLWTHLDSTVARHDEVEAKRASDHARTDRRITLLIRISAVGAAAASAAVIVAVLMATGVV